MNPTPNHPSSQSDLELLRQYAQNRSADAFSQIVVRYVDLVYSAAIRQVRDSDLAEDVSQAVFLLLSQQAHKIKAGTMLGGWFLLTTRNIARNAQRREQRLKIRERRKAAEMESKPRYRNDPATQLVNESISALLDDAIMRLNAIDRDVIVHRFFLCESHRDIALATGLSEATAAKRLSRALLKLREILQSQGITTSETALISTLPAIALISAPPGLVAAVHSAITGTSVSAAATTLVKSAGFRAHVAVGWSIAALVAITLTIGLYVAVSQVGFSGKAASPTSAPASAAPVVAAPVVAAPGVEPTITLIMVDPQNANKIVTEATVDVTMNGRTSANGHADASGQYIIHPPAGFASLRAIIRAPGRVPMAISWSNYTLRGGVPPIYNIPLEQGVPLGGIVKDEAGNPIAGAQVRISISRIDGEIPLPLLESVTTDAQGRWTMDHAPSNLPLPNNLSVSGPLGFEMLPGDSKPWLDAARKQAHVTIAKAAGIGGVHGVVMAPDGTPAIGAEVFVGTSRFVTNKLTVRTDGAGRFMLPALGQYQDMLTISAPGASPELVRITAENKGQEIKVQLLPPNKIEGWLVDSTGAAVPDVQVHAVQWRMARTLSWNARTDMDGHFAWTEAPADEVQFDIFGRDRMSVRNYSITAGKTPPKILMHIPVQVSGKVIDQETGEPIKQFKLTYGNVQAGRNEVTWQTSSARTLTNGQYEATLNEIYFGGRLRVEADGYKPLISRLIQPDEEVINLDLEMQKGAGPAGVVVDASAKPIAGIRLYCIPSKINIFGDLSQLDRNASVLKTQTDDAGKFLFQPLLEEGFTLIGVGPAGNVIINDDQFAKNSTIQLQPWARIEGTFRINTKPAVNMQIAAEVRLPGSRINKSFMRTANIDADGKFVLEQLFPGSTRILRIVPMDSNSTRYLQLASVIVNAGDSLKQDLGGSGRPVIGKLILPPSMADKIDWRTTSISLDSGQFDPRQIPFPDRYPEMTLKEQSDWQAEWAASPATLEIRRNSESQHFTANFIVSPDGSIRADDVRPGSYFGLAIVRIAPASGNPQTIQERINGQLSASKRVAFTITDEEIKLPSEVPLDLGDIQLKLPPAVGDIIEPMTLSDLAGQPVRLADFRGKVVLLNLWRLQDTSLVPILQSIQAKYGQRSDFAIINVGLSMLPAWAQRISEQSKMPGVQWIDEKSWIGDGATNALGTYIGRSVFLISAEGQLLAKNLNDGKQIQDALEIALKSMAN